MDGVLWRAGKTIDGAPETLEYLLSQNKKIFFATNNATSTRIEVGKLSLDRSFINLLQFVEKLQKLGFGTFNEDQFYCTAWVAGEVLKSRNIQGKV